MLARAAYADFFYLYKLLQLNFPETKFTLGNPTFSNEIQGLLRNPCVSEHYLTEKLKEEGEWDECRGFAKDTPNFYSQVKRHLPQYATVLSIKRLLAEFDARPLIQWEIPTDDYEF